MQNPGMLPDRVAGYLSTKMSEFIEYYSRERHLAGSQYVPLRNLSLSDITNLYAFAQDGNVIALNKLSKEGLEVAQAFIRSVFLEL